jgi:hypothetical protein
MYTSGARRSRGEMSKNLSRGRVRRRHPQTDRQDAWGPYLGGVDAGTVFDLGGRILGACAEAEARAAHGGIDPQAPSAERAHSMLPPNPESQEGAPMPPRHPNHLPIHSAVGPDAIVQQQMRAVIESNWHTVYASRRSIEDAREAIARADKALARQLSDRRR